MPARIAKGRVLFNNCHSERREGRAAAEPSRRTSIAASDLPTIAILQLRRRSAASLRMTNTREHANSVYFAFTSRIVSSTTSPVIASDCGLSFSTVSSGVCQNTL